MHTLCLSPTPVAIQQAAEHLQQGHLVAMPTETVYGLAGDALNPEAVLRIFQTKNRPTFDPLIVHLAPPDPFTHWLSYLEQDLNLVKLDRLRPYTAELEHLLYHSWPGPLTIVLPRTERIPDLVSSGLPTVALRVPRHPIAQALIRAANTPLAAPSANRFGRISPTSAAAVLAELAGRILYILDGGPCEIGLESTVIVPQPDGSLTLLRPGGIPLQTLQSLTHLPIHPRDQQVEGSFPSPGLLKSHYAPGKPFLLLPQGLERLTRPELDPWLQELPRPLGPVGILLFSGDPVGKVQQLADWLEQDPVEIEVQVLSATGDLQEAARTLFQKVRLLDEGSSQLLLAEPCPTQVGLGYAITDRLQRATRIL